MFNFTSPLPLSLYIHIPWCLRKCPYCDFNSHEAGDSLPEQAYIDALITDLEQELPAIWGRTIHSLFFGGGTPSLMSAAGLDQLLSRIRTLVPLAPYAEITLEANPGTAEQARFRDFRQLGINRLSIGVQSFSDSALEELGRVHDGAEARQAFSMARDAGFDNINIDLMYGLPQQDVNAAVADLDQALALQPEHLSHYQLTLEPNTLFHHQPPPLPGDDTLWDMQLACQSRLAAAGFEHYEISAYASNRHRCRHNLNYWEFGDYVGIGAGAHGKITDTFKQHIQRTTKPRRPQAYIDAARRGKSLGRERIVTREEIGLEYLMNALRLHQGFPVHQFQERSGQPLSLIEKPLQQAEHRKLLHRDIHHIRATENGRRYLNELLTLFM